MMDGYIGDYFSVQAFSGIFFSEIMHKTQNKNVKMSMAKRGKKYEIDQKLLHPSHKKNFVCIENEQ